MSFSSNLRTLSNLMTADCGERKVGFSLVPSERQIEATPRTHMFINLGVLISALGKLV